VSISKHFAILSRADFLETLQSSIVASTPPRVYMTTRVLCLFGAREGGGREVGTPTFLHPVHLATVNSRCGGGSISPADTVMGGGNSLARLSHGCSTRGIHTYVCCIYGLSPWRMASVGLMHNLSKMIVVPDSAGDARLISWRCQLSAHACVQDIQDILRIPYI